MRSVMHNLTKMEDVFAKVLFGILTCSALSNIFLDVFQSQGYSHFSVPVSKKNIWC